MLWSESSGSGSTRSASPRSASSGPQLTQALPSTEPESTEPESIEAELSEPELSEPEPSGSRPTDTQLSPSMIPGQFSCDIRYLERRARDLNRLTKRVREELQIAKEAREKTRKRRGGSSLRASYMSRRSERISNPSSLCSTRARHYGMRGNEPPIRHISVNNRAFS
ncbi:hypothetical protein PENSTE_c002G06431 [Penicillium steckii]|uniref:Uncharacterized protein n=1 Tax=Penicillium steckii TaxID=303698 RepID=A0A1V6TT48_9EURO|nr:hypothetical protein PENSTE_c002G06431 [Penicillium steckii]